MHIHGSIPVVVGFVVVWFLVVVCGGHQAFVPVL